MIYQISSGQGPAECELGVALLLRYFQTAYGITVLDATPGYYEGTFRSARFFTEEDLGEFLGSVQWICRSPYRPTHGRKNWFLDFSACVQAETGEFDPDQVIFETFRSGGKGGQNVNKVESGVRAIYLPLGRAVVCTEERSQYANRQKALAHLRKLVKRENEVRKAGEKSDNWRCHTAIVRGSAGAVFEGMEFRKRV